MLLRVACVVQSPSGDSQIFILVVLADEQCVLLVVSPPKWPQKKSRGEIYHNQGASMYPHCQVGCGPLRVSGCFSYTCALVTSTQPGTQMMMMMVMVTAVMTVMMMMIRVMTVTELNQGTEDWKWRLHVNFPLL